MARTLEERLEGVIQARDAAQAERWPVPCAACGAQVGEYCMSNKGRRAELHAVRIREEAAQGFSRKA